MRPDMSSWLFIVHLFYMQQQSEAQDLVNEHKTKQLAWRAAIPAVYILLEKTKQYL